MPNKAFIVAIQTGDKDHRRTQARAWSEFPEEAYKAALGLSKSAQLFESDLSAKIFICSLMHVKDIGCEDDTTGVCLVAERTGLESWITNRLDYKALGIPEPKLQS